MSPWVTRVDFETSRTTHKSSQFHVRLHRTCSRFNTTRRRGREKALELHRVPRQELERPDGTATANSSPGRSPVLCIPGTISRLTGRNHLQNWFCHSTVCELSSSPVQATVLISVIRNCSVFFSRWFRKSAQGFCNGHGEFVASLRVDTFEMERPCRFCFAVPESLAKRAGP